MPESFQAVPAKRAIPASRSQLSAALIALAAAVGLILAPLIVERFALAGAGDNILVEARVKATSTIGVIGNMLRGPFPVEANWMRAPTLIRLAAGRGIIEFDFGEPTRLAAIVLQAPANDRYQVEVSLDGGSTWRPIWTVEKSPERAGPPFRNRQTQFDPPLEVTHLKLSSQTAYGTQSAISALRAYSTLPEAWPALTVASSPSLASRYPWTLEHEVVSVARFFAALVAVSLLFLCSRAFRRGFPERIQLWLKRSAIIASMVAGLGWWNLMQLTPAGVDLLYENYWDVYHYYLAGKYAPELGHARLYDCYLAAEVEDGLGTHQRRRPLSRDLATYELVPTVRALLLSEKKCKTHFSEARWEEWKHDHVFFRTRMRPLYWIGMPMDQGFNGSPAWLILGRGLASIVPISDVSFHLLISLDTLCFVLMWYVAWLSFGWRATCAGIVFWGTNYVAGNYFTLGAYLRFDWLFLTVAGICWVKQERNFLAGAALAYATTLRLFPAFVVLGLILKIACEMVQARRVTLRKPHRQLIAGGVLTTLLILGLSVAVSGRTTAWQEFRENLTQHVAYDKSQQIGLPSLLRYTESYLEQESRGWHAAGRQGQGIGGPEESRHGSRPGSFASLFLRVALPLLLLPLLIVAISKEKEWIAAILGIGLIPFAADVSNYYWVMLLAFSFLGVRSELAGKSFAGVTLLLSGLCFAFGLTGTGDGQDSLLYPVGSVIIIAYVFWITGLFAFSSRVEPAANGLHERAG